MVMLVTAHKTVKKLCTKVHVDGFGGGMGMGLYYNVPKHNFGKVCNALVLVGFKRVERTKQHHSYVCGSLVVDVIFEEGPYSNVMLHNTQSPSYLDINTVLGKIPG